MKQSESVVATASNIEPDLISFPYEINFADSESSPATRELIESHLSVLDDFKQRITHARVIVRIPHKHSGLRFYHIHIQLDVPGKRLVVSREPEANEAHADVRLAVADAFAKIEHQLQALHEKRSGH